MRSAYNFEKAIDRTLKKFSQKIDNAVSIRGTSGTLTLTTLSIFELKQEGWFRGAKRRLWGERDNIIKHRRNVKEPKLEELNEMLDGMRVNGGSSEKNMSRERLRSR